jgi:hypothetical protein
MSDLGFPIGQSSLAKLENGSRKITLDEAVALTVALDVAPTSLLISWDAEGQIALAPKVTATTRVARSWFRGWTCLPEQDIHAFLTEMPRDEWFAHRNTLVASMADLYEAITDAQQHADDPEQRDELAEIGEHLSGELLRLRRRLASQVDAIQTRRSGELDISGETPDGTC